MTLTSPPRSLDMPIVATAGHVDHGKSTLVEALTGRNPDRWDEEKERGLTIDLGFAWTAIGDLTVGFVDVPGHERFIKNMLAGVDAIDVALFVVAADEGWMPQSEEHLAILDILRTTDGVIALTRIDLADDETIDFTELSVLEAIEKTTMENWPIVRVSPVTGAGMDDLRRSLSRALAAAGPSADRGRPRLWIDRAFRVAGAGQIVTGTLTGGSISQGTELMLWPGEQQVRVRGLQSHDRAVAQVDPGTRAALNIIGGEGARRGAMLGRPDDFRTSSRFLGDVRLVRTHDDELTGRGAFHLHAGSGAWPVQVRVIDSGPQGYAVLLRSRTGIPLHAGDRFILRETGRRAVVGGGTILDPQPPVRGGAMRAAVTGLREALPGGPDIIADALLAVRGTAQLAEIRRDSGGGVPSSAFSSGTLAIAEEAATDLHAAILGELAAFHRDNRLRPGMPKAAISSKLQVEPVAVTALIAGSDDVVDDGATVRLIDFSPGLDPAEEQAWDSARRRLEESLAVPRASQLHMPRELLHALERAGQLVKVGDDLVYLPDQIEAITEQLRALRDEFTVAEFRDLMGITRRQAIPLLEWFDRQGTTVRRGDGRTVRAD